MSHPIRTQTICGVNFYRMGHTLIANKGRHCFVATQLTGGSWEARWQMRDGLKMPIGGAVCETLRAAVEYLRPEYEATAGT